MRGGRKADRNADTSKVVDGQDFGGTGPAVDGQRDQYGPPERKKRPST